MSSPRKKRQPYALRSFEPTVFNHEAQRVDWDAIQRRTKAVQEILVMAFDHRVKSKRRYISEAFEMLQVVMDGFDMQDLAVASEYRERRKARAHRRPAKRLNRIAENQTENGDTENE